MRFRAKIVPLLVAGLPAVGCATTDDKAIAKTDTVAKQDPKSDPKQDPKPDVKPDPKPIVPIVIDKPEDIPVALGGAPMPYEPPPPEPPKGDGKAPAPAPAPSAPAAAAPTAAAAPSPTRPSAITLAHNHPPGEACKPLTREEVEKALADLKK